MFGFIALRHESNNNFMTTDPKRIPEGHPDEGGDLLLQSAENRIKSVTDSGYAYVTQ